jgi:hypothetical protein
MATRIIFNGQEYAGTDAMPEAVRKSYLDALAKFAEDKNRNGIPDILEPGSAGQVIGIQHSSITVNGRTYESVEEMPALARILYEHAMGKMGASRTGLPTSAAAIRGLRPTSQSNEQPAPADLMRAVDSGRRAIERVIQLLLGFMAAFIFTGAVFIMLEMDRGSQAKERLFVAIIALVLLGTLDTQATRLIKRRLPSSLGTTEVERRYSGASLLLMLAAAVILIGLALFLP